MGDQARPVSRDQVAQRPLDEQLDMLRDVLARNHILSEVLGRASQLGAPGWYVTAWPST